MMLPAMTGISDVCLVVREFVAVEEGELRIVALVEGTLRIAA